MIVSNIDLKSVVDDINAEDHYTHNIVILRYNILGLILEEIQTKNSITFNLEDKFFEVFGEGFYMKF